MFPIPEGFGFVFGDVLSGEHLISFSTEFAFAGLEPSEFLA
jgi:hypothetical protein